VLNSNCFKAGFSKKVTIKSSRLFRRRRNNISEIIIKCYFSLLITRAFLARLSRGFSKASRWAYPFLPPKLSIFAHAVRKGPSEIHLPWHVAGAAGSEPGCYLRVDCQSRAVLLQSRFLGSHCTRRACILSVNGRRELASIDR